MKRFLSIALVALLLVCSLVSFVPVVYASDPNYNPGYVNDPDFVAGDLLEFTIEVYNGEDPTGVTHTLSGNPYSLRLGDLVNDHIIFDGGELGLCAFVISGGCVVLRTGMGAGGVYDQHYMLYNQVPFISEDMYLLSGNYEAVLMCQDNLTHELIVKSSIAPTCTETGTKVWGCAFCDATVKTESIPALGHDYDVLGQCTREGCNSNAVGDFFGNVGDAVGGAIDNVKDELDKGLDKVEENLPEFSFGENLKNFGKTILWILGLILGIVLLVLLWPVLKGLVDLIATGVKAVASGIKKLSKRRKGKK